MREFGAAFGNKVILPFLAMLAVAWLVSGCAVLLPEAARQVKELITPSEPLLPSDQRLVAQADAAIMDRDYAAAEAYLDAALSINPFHAGAISRLAEIYRLTGRKRKAFELDRLDAKMVATFVPEGEELIESDATDKIIERFATLARLRDAGLIAPEEFALRRSANLGALLPLTQPPPALSSDLPAPRARDVVARLEDIARFYMIGAIDVEAYETERFAILDGLMPLPSDRGAAPRDAASVDPEIHQTRLDRLLAAELISPGEYDVESAALIGLFLPAAAPLAGAAGKTPPSEATAGLSLAADGAPALGPAFATRVDIHLALSRTPERAQHNWEILHEANSDVLAGLEPRIARIDLGDDKGIFFQLSAGPLADMAAAEALCDTLARRRLYCAPMIF